MDSDLDLELPDLDCSLEIPDFTRLMITSKDGRRLPPSRPIECIALSDNDEPGKKDGRKRSFELRSESSGSKSRATSEDAVEARKKAVAKKKAVRKSTSAAELAARALDTTQKQWIAAEEETTSKDSEDEDIDNFIRENHDKPNEFWDAISEKMEKQGKDYQIDYIIATEKDPAPLQSKIKVWILTKWANYAIPTWNLSIDVFKGGRKNCDQLILMEKKLEVEAKLEKLLTSAMGGKTAFDKAFPHRWIETSEELSVYVEDERALYLNKVKAWEWRINFEYYAMQKVMKRNGWKEIVSSPIFVINWVDQGTVPGMDNDFKFITKSRHTQRVADILANTNELGWVKCGHATDATKRCNKVCSVPREHYQFMNECCGKKYGATIHYEKKKIHARMGDPAIIETVPEIGEATKKRYKKKPEKKKEVKKEDKKEVKKEDKKEVKKEEKKKEGKKEEKKEGKKEEKKKGKKTEEVKKEIKEEPEEEEEEEEDDNIKLIVPPQLTNHEVENGIVVECTPECGCDQLVCRQNIVQRGRQIPLIIFREDPAKGWGLRAGADIKRNEFVTEYVGEVLTAKEQAKNYAGSHYMFTMRFGWAENLLRTDRVKNLPEDMKRDIIRRHKPLSIDATNMGNESRFINHSCEPNLVSMAVFVERNGEFYHRIALFARKDIAFGEELTFDYFPSEKDIGVWRSMFDKCRCGTASCKFKELEAEEMFSDEEDDDNMSTVSSLDSFLSDDEAYQLKKKAIESQEKEEKKRMEEKGRKKKKEKKRVKTEEEESEDEENETQRTHRVTDLTRDPVEILLERCDGDEERLKQLIKERTESGGILGMFMKIPFDADKQQAMFEDAREKRAARKEEQAREEQRLREENERMEEERKKREGEGGGTNEERKKNDRKRKRSDK